MNSQPSSTPHQEASPAVMIQGQEESPSTSMSLTTRAETILALAKKLDAHLEQHDLPYPSFDENDCLDSLPTELQEQRWALVDATNDLKKLARGPVMHAVDVAMSVSFAMMTL